MSLRRNADRRAGTGDRRFWVVGTVHQLGRVGHVIWASAADAAQARFLRAHPSAQSVETTRTEAPA